MQIPLLFFLRHLATILETKVQVSYPIKIQRMIKHRLSPTFLQRNQIPKILRFLVLIFLLNSFLVIQAVSWVYRVFFVVPKYLRIKPKLTTYFNFLPNRQITRHLSLTWNDSVSENFIKNQTKNLSNWIGIHPKISADYL